MRWRSLPAGEVLPDAYVAMHLDPDNACDRLTGRAIRKCIRRYATTAVLVAAAKK